MYSIAIINGARSSTVEHFSVAEVVAGSNPVGHPAILTRFYNSSFDFPGMGFELCDCNFLFHFKNRRPRGGSRPSLRSRELVAACSAYHL